MANTCPQCGSFTNPNLAFCENCGAKLILPEEPRVPQETNPEPKIHTESLEEDHYVSVDAPDFPEYPSNQPITPKDDFVIPRPGAAGNTGPVSSQPPQNPNSFIQPAVGNSSSVIPPENTSIIPPAASSNKKRLPIILGLAAVLLVALFFLLRKPKEPKPSVVAAPEPTPFAVKSPDIQTPSESSGTDTAQTDVQQGMPYFVRYNIPCDAVVNEDYRYPGIYDDGSEETAYGTLTFISYSSSPFSEDLIADGKRLGFELEGYDLRSLSAQVDFTQADASERSVLVTRYVGDYYDQDLLNDTYEKLTDADGDSYYRYEIDNHGKRQYVYYYVVSEWKDWDTYLEYTQTDYFFVPSDYDGVVRGFVNPKCEDPSIDNEPEDNFLFRIE